MKPIVNTDIKMSKKMLDALTLFETYCVATLIKETNKSEVKKFLEINFGKNIANNFKEEYLY